MKSLVRSLRNRLVERSFDFWQSLGVHVTQNHFYKPVPDTSHLPEELWKRRSEMIGIDMREAEQIGLLDRFIARYKQEYDAFARQPTAIPHEFHFANDQFGSVDAEILYCMVRDRRPRRIYEIGSGHSTFVAARAALQNEAEGAPRCELVAFEPFPNELLQRGFPGLERLVQRPVQDVPIDQFSDLDENDILFVDSTHVLKIGSDVQYEYLELLPRLHVGVLVHVHDIFLPSEYPRRWVMQDHKFWNEQYVLQAFLAFNDRFRVLWGGSFMHLQHPERLERGFQSYHRDRVWPGSFWIRRE